MTTYHCEIELLSPLHIGSGSSYVNNFDFLYDRNSKKISVFDRDQLLLQVQEAGEKAIASFTAAIEEERFPDWLTRNQHGVDYQQAVFQRGTSKRRPNEIKAHIRSGMGAPLIPGSSLKGALRTAVLARLFTEDNGRNVASAITSLLATQNRPKLQFADRQICQALLGENPQVDLMRSLSVGDCSFQPSDLALQQVIVNRPVQTRDGAGFPTKFGVIIESLRKESRAAAQISFDEYLSEHGPERLGFTTGLDREWLLDAVRAKTEKTLHTETAFLGHLQGRFVDRLREFYTSLEARVKCLSSDEVILQLGWGSGWNGTTGELLTKEALTDEVRRKLKLAPGYLDFTFPKSRKLAVLGKEGNEDVVPMGWIRVRFRNKEALIREQQAERTARQEQAEAEAADRDEWDAMTDAQRAVAVINHAPIARRMAPGQEPTHVWSKFEQLDEEGKKEVAEAFAEFWEQSEKTWRKNVCTKGQWKKIETIIALLDWKHPDIVRISKEENQAAEQIAALNDWGQYKQQPLDLDRLTLTTAKLLEERFKKWGCANRKAKKDKKRALQELQQKIRRLQTAS